MRWFEDKTTDQLQSVVSPDKYINFIPVFSSFIKEMSYHLGRNMSRVFPVFKRGTKEVKFDKMAALKKYLDNSRNKMEGFSKRIMYLLIDEAGGETADGRDESITGPLISNLVQQVQQLRTQLNGVSSRATPRSPSSAEFFRVQGENATLKGENADLKEQNADLKEQLESAMETIRSLKAQQRSAGNARDQREFATEEKAGPSGFSREEPPSTSHRRYDEHGRRAMEAWSVRTPSTSLERKHQGHRSPPRSPVGTAVRSRSAFSLEHSPGSAPRSASYPARPSTCKNSPPPKRSKGGTDADELGFPATVAKASPMEEWEDLLRSFHRSEWEAGEVAIADIFDRKFDEKHSLIKFYPCLTSVSESSIKKVESWFFSECPYIGDKATLLRPLFHQGTHWLTVFLESKKRTENSSRREEVNILLKKFGCSALSHDGSEKANARIAKALTLCKLWEFVYPN